MHRHWFVPLAAAAVVAVPITLSLARAQGGATTEAPVVLTPEPSTLPSGTVAITPEADPSAPKPPAPVTVRLSELKPSSPRESGFDGVIRDHAQALFDEGRTIFRYETYGNEAYWGGSLRLHEAIEGGAFGGSGSGLTPRDALELGLKIDADAVPGDLAASFRAGQARLDDPGLTLELLRANAIVGLTGFPDDGGGLRSLGMQCALCHSTVDNSVSPGVGRRLDGWANRDLDVGALLARAPDLGPLAEPLGMEEGAMRDLLKGWGRGRYDALLALDGKGTRPDGKSGATLIPSLFGLAGVDRAGYTGWGSTPHLSAMFAAPILRGQGSFRDARLENASLFPVASHARLGHLTGSPERLAAKLPALHFYQLAIPAPAPPSGSFEAAAAARGREVFREKGRCVTCHVDGLTTEPGWNLHKPDEIGIDAIQADRSPERRYRTTPLSGLWTRAKGGYYHDGRFATLREVVSHYETVMALGMTESERGDLVEYLKSLGGTSEAVVADAEKLNATTGLTSGGVVLTEAWRLNVRPSPAVRGLTLQISLSGIASGGAPPDLSTEVLDASGRIVTTLGGWTLEPARRVATSSWNGRDVRGRLVDPGEYYVRVSSASAGYKLDRRIVLR